MDSTNYTTGRLTAYFVNDDDAKKAHEELLEAGVPDSAVGLKKIQSDDESFLDVVNRFFGSESERFEAGTVLTLDDPAHGTEALGIIQRHAGQIELRHTGSGEPGSGESGIGTQSAGNP